MVTKEQTQASVSEPKRSRGNAFPRPPTLCASTSASTRSSPGIVTFASTELERDYLCGKGL
jgi:hypothetical protein